MSYRGSREIFQETLQSIRGEGLYKEERLICSPQGAEIQVKFPAEAPERKLINLCSNNYLGLSNHPELLKSAHSGLEGRGYGLSSVRFICGTQDSHRELENKLSQFLKMEDTCLFGSCFDANGALFEAILSAEDAIYSDRLVHASLIDGMRLCKAQKHVFEHSDLSELETKLKTTTGRIKLIITDGVFSMDGDMARLDELAALAEKYQALLAVDDSHATGFIGKTGRGTHEHFNVMDKVDIITTTFGKALGGATGGCISARKEIIDLIKQRGRPYLFSNALMPAVVSATLTALDLVMESTERRDRLEKLTRFWRAGLTDLGFDLKPGNTPIVPVMLYDAKKAQEFSRALFTEGVFAVGFFFPVVPKGQARIRTQMSAALTEEHLKEALSVFKSVKERIAESNNCAK